MSGLREGVVKAFDMDFANKGLYRVYRNPADPTDDPAVGVALLDIETKDAKLVFIDGWDGASAGLVDLGKDMRRRLEEVLDAPLAELFDAMRGEGLLPVVCSVVTNQDRETAESLEEALASSGDSALHLVIRNAFGNDAQAPSWSSLDGLSEALTRAKAVFLDMPQLDRDIAEELKETATRFESAAEYFARRSANTYKIKVGTWLRKMDAAWAGAFEEIERRAEGARPILIFTSNKGGVGKSTAAKSCLDWLRSSR